MGIRKMIGVGLMVLPFLALGTQADSLDLAGAAVADVLPSQPHRDSLVGSSAGLDSTTLFEGNTFGLRMAFSGNNGASPWCRRVFLQGGISSMGCGGFPGFGGKPIIVLDPGGEAALIPDLQNQTTAVPDPSTFLLVATGLLGGVVRLRRLMR